MAKKNGKKQSASKPSKRGGAAAAKPAAIQAWEDDPQNAIFGFPGDSRPVERAQVRI